MNKINITPDKVSILQCNTDTLNGFSFLVVIDGNQKAQWVRTGIK